MGILTDKVRALLGLQKDADYPYLKPTEYLDALNIRHISQSGSTGISIQNVLGSTAAFGLDHGVQIKRYRIYLDVTAARSYDIDITDANDTNIGATGAIVGPINDLTTARANIIVAINGAISADYQTQFYTLVTTATDIGYFDMDMALVAVPSGGYEYFLENAVGATDDLEFAVVAEAIDVSLIGVLSPIGSFDLGGDSFIYWSPCEHLPETIDIASITDNGSGVFRIATASDHDLTTGMSVTISGATGYVGLNGVWLIDVISDTTFDLLTSVYAAGTGLGTINTYVSGYGVISVSQQAINTLSWTITSLLRSKELNFRIAKPIDCFSEQNIYLQSHYFTDDYNDVRVFYYSGDYELDGAIQAINPDGRYTYGSINDEIKLILTNTDVRFVWTNQYQSGGAVLSGNHRYAIRFLTEGFSATTWTDLTNPINVCIADVTQGDNSLDSAGESIVGGNDAFTPTSKINEFEIENIIPGLFKYVELADINYVNSSFQGQIVRRDLLTGSDTQIIQHTGNETDVQDLDVATLNFLAPDIRTARNINAIDNRLVISNITAQAHLDFSTWTASWLHTIKRSEIDSVQYPESGTYLNEEYIVPYNVHNNMGHVLNETYRYSAKFRLKSGGFSQNFWIDDVRFDCLTTNTIANPDDDRRTGSALTSLDLTDASASVVYVHYVEFNTIDLSFLIDGVPARELIDEILIERVDMISSLRDIVASGIIVLASKPQFHVITGLRMVISFIFNIGLTQIRRMIKLEIFCLLPATGYTTRMALMRTTLTIHLLH